MEVIITKHIILLTNKIQNRIFKKTNKQKTRKIQKLKCQLKQGSKVNNEQCKIVAN